ncbi:unnamed protein product [Arctogadus glacialis]
MVDSISLAEESSQADPSGQGSVANPSPPETMVGGCIEPGRFAKWREGREWLTVTTDRIPYEGEICNFFFHLIELQSCTGESICDTLLQSLAEQGISEDVLRSRLIGIATDGAASMMGKYRGKHQLFQSCEGPLEISQMLGHSYPRDPRYKKGK